MKRGKPLKSDPAKTRAWQQRSKPISRTVIVTPRQNGLSSRASGQRESKSKRKPRRNDGPWRAEVMARYGPACVSCGDRAHVQADHMMPRSQQGASDPRNGLPLCGEFSRNTPGGCHPAKTASRILIRHEWLQPEQIEYLAEVGWVWWDEDGLPAGRGYKHFAPIPASRN